MLISNTCSANIKCVLVRMCVYRRSQLMSKEAPNNMESVGIGSRDEEASADRAI